MAPLEHRLWEHPTVCRERGLAAPDPVSRGDSLARARSLVTINSLTFKHNGVPPFIHSQSIPSIGGVTFGGAAAVRRSRLFTERGTHLALSVQTRRVRRMLDAGLPRQPLPSHDKRDQ